MKELRIRAVEKARTASTVGLILGTLGRQGNINVLECLKVRKQDKPRLKLRKKNQILEQ